MTPPRPQRLFAPSPPGTLLKRAGAAASPQPPRKRALEDADYLKQVRSCPCLYCGLDPAGEAAHVRLASFAYRKASGMGKRPEDRFALPLCGDDHRTAKHAQHNRNESEFWESLGINPLLTATKLYAQRGDLVAMRGVCFVAIAGRDKK